MPKLLMSWLTFAGPLFLLLMFSYTDEASDGDTNLI